MTESDRLLLKLLSLLLQYPDPKLTADLAGLGELAGELPEACLEQIHRRFLPYLQSSPLLSIQQAYTQTFDLNPATCLYLTYHRWGDGKERGRDLARLRRSYQDAGYEDACGELPDYLPMVLEFASVSPGDTGFALLREFSSEIEQLHAHLQESRSPYAGLLGLLAEVFTAPGPEDERRDDELE